MNTRSKRVSYLSPTLPVVVHDKALADWVNIQYPPATTWRSDLGSCGYHPHAREHLQLKKAQGGGTNTWPEAPQSQTGAHTRVRVEHAIAGIKL